MRFVISGDSVLWVQHKRLCPLGAAVGVQPRVPIDPPIGWSGRRPPREGDGARVRQDSVDPGSNPIAPETSQSGVILQSTTTGLTFTIKRCEETVP
jgi:hypothetical protein